MTAKRFEVVMNEFDEVEYISDIVDCEDRDFAEFMDFVETLCKENEQLKESAYSWSKSYNRVYEENKQLKFQLNNCLNHKIFSRRELEKENEHIKTTIKTMMENERTELGQSVLKQLWEQIE